MRISRGASLVLPTITVMIVMFAVFVAGVPRPYAAARVYGGPSEGAKWLAWRLEAVERLGESEVPLTPRRLRVRISSAGRALGEWTGSLDAAGSAELALGLSEPVRAPLEVSVLDVDADRLLAQGPVDLARARWQAAQRQRGGWLEARSSGALSLRAAPGRGVFAVPFAEPLWIEVRRDGRPLPGAAVSLTVDGGELRPSGAEPRRVTDDRGFAVFSVAPLEHVTTVEVSAEAPDGARGELRTVLPVVPGALRATMTGEGLAIESPIPRTLAYFALVDRTTRFAGGAVKLSLDEHGGASGAARLRLPERLPHPLWAVVSSEPDLRSPAAVGWPVAFNAGEPPRTLEVYDHLLLDGSKMGFEREQLRLRRVRWVTTALCAVALAISVTLLVARVRLADKRLASHLGESGLAGQAASVAPARPWLVAAAVLSVLLGFLVLALVALYRVG